MKRTYHFGLDKVREIITQHQKPTIIKDFDIDPGSKKSLNMVLSAEINKEDEFEFLLTVDDDPAADDDDK